jgi:hypothetical protein
VSAAGPSKAPRLSQNASLDRGRHESLQRNFSSKNDQRPTGLGTDSQRIDLQNIIRGKISADTWKH